MGKGINKLWHSYTMEYLLTIKKRNLLVYTATEMNTIIQYMPPTAILAPIGSCPLLRGLEPFFEFKIPAVIK